MTSQDQGMSRRFLSSARPPLANRLDMGRKIWQEKLTVFRGISAPASLKKLKHRVVRVKFCNFIQEWIDGEGQDRLDRP